MTTTTFTSGTVIASTWLNDVNDVVYGEAQHVAPLGTVSIPSYSFLGDTNTGMWSPAADTIAWSINGGESFRISSTGFGIGGTSDGAKLFVRNDSGGRVFTFGSVTGDSAGTYMSMIRNNVAYGYIGSGEVLSLATSADLAIRSDTGSIYFGQGASLRGNVTGNGLAGVSSADGQGLSAVFRVTPTGTNGGGLNFYNWNNASSDIQMGQIQSLTTSGAEGVENAALVFKSIATGSLTEKARITSSGDFNIKGTTLNIATTKTPASASDTGTTGDIVWDSSYVYVCVATNTWKRSALSTW